MGNLNTIIIPYLPSKFKPGDKVRLTGLIDHPEDNGKLFTIRALRPLQPLEKGSNPYCPSGRAYYLEEPLDWADWVYEERLKLDDGVQQ